MTICLDFFLERNDQNPQNPPENVRQSENVNFSFHCQEWKAVMRKSLFRFCFFQVTLY